MFSQFLSRFKNVASKMMDGGGEPSQVIAETPQQGGVQNLGIGVQAPALQAPPLQDVSKDAQLTALTPDQANPQPLPQTVQQPMPQAMPQQPMFQMAQQDAMEIQQPQMSMFDKYMDNVGNRFNDKINMWNNSSGLMDFAAKNRQYNRANGIKQYQAPQSNLMAAAPNQAMPYRGGY